MFLVFFIAMLSQTLSASIPKYVEMWEGKGQPFTLHKDPWGKGDYLNPLFLNHIDKNEIHFVIEIGSRDVIDALELSEYYNAHVCAFECNPQALEICSYNQNKNPNVSIIPYAAWNETKPMTFYPVIEGGKTVFNLGASSLFKFDFQWDDYFKQGEITVNAIRLDEWLTRQQYETPDLICIDAQGATLQVLQGLGKKLSQVKYIIAEAEINRFY